VLAVRLRIEKVPADPAAGGGPPECCHVVPPSIEYSTPVTSIGNSTGPTPWYTFDAGFCTTCKVYRTLRTDPSPVTARATACTGAGGSHSVTEPSLPDPGAGDTFVTSETSVEPTSGGLPDGPMAISDLEPAGREGSSNDDG
jgi:hypothetical protein